MTREDAISIMNVIVHMLEDKYDTDRVEEAVEMAIQALEQEPMREFTEEEAKAYSKALDKIYKPMGFNVFDEYGNYKYPSDVKLTEPNMATSMPCDDVVSIEAVIEWLKAKDIIKMSSQEEKARKELTAFPSVRPQEPKTDYKAFAEWVAREIFDDMWEYNKDAFAEVACRKLAKLGIVKASGNVWELVEQESEG